MCSPFSFPTGRAPRFNPGHLAVGPKPWNLAAVPAVGQHALIPLNRDWDFNTAGPDISPVINSIIGPAQNCDPCAAASTQAFRYSLLSTPVTVDCTTITSAIIYFCSNTTNITEPIDDISPQNVKYWASVFGSGRVDTPDGTQQALPNPTLGHAYFFAHSAKSGAAGNWVLRDLTTGRLQSGSYAVGAWGATTMSAIDLCVGGFVNGGNCGQHIGPFMRSYSKFLSLAELTKWSEDPWSYWYPHNIENYEYFIAAGAAPSFSAIFRRSLSRLGARVGMRQTHKV